MEEARADCSFALLLVNQLNYWFLKTSDQINQYATDKSETQRETSGENGRKRERKQYVGNTLQSNVS